MNITFGIYLDGYVEADPPDSLDRMICGPAGMADVFETRLGLKGGSASHARRIVDYRSRLEELLTQRATFYKASFSKDLLAVAQTLLQWRDGLLSERFAPLATVQGIVADYFHRHGRRAEEQVFAFGAKAAYRWVQRKKPKQ